MSSWVKWLLSTIAVYLVFLIATIPANQLIGRLTLPDNVEFEGVSGTIWRGTAQTVVYDGIAINKVDWDLSFLPLLWGSLNADIKAGNSRDNDEISVSGPLSISVLNPANFSTEGLSAFIPADIVMSYLPLPIPIQAEGRFRVDIDDLEFNQQCELLMGKGQWLNARIPGSRGPIELGTFAATLGCQEGSTLLTVSEPNLFGLSAVVRIPPDMQFTIDGQFKPDASLPRDVHTAAKFFGEPNAQGYYTINF